MFPGRENQAKVWGQVAYYTGLGFILPAAAVAGFMLGWFLDRWLHTSPVLAAVMGFLGAGAGFVEVLALLKRAEKNAGGDEPTDGPPSG